MPGKGQLPTLCPPEVGSGPHSLGTPGAHRSRRAGLSWWDSGWGPRWRWSRNAAGWSQHSPAAACTWGGKAASGPSWAPPLPQPPGPSPCPGASPCLQGAPAAVGIGRAHAVPAGGVHGTRSDFHPNHLQAEVGAQLSGAAGPSLGTQPGEGHEKLGKLRLDTRTQETREQGFPAEVKGEQAKEVGKEGAPGGRNSVCKGQASKTLSSPWDLVRPGRQPYLVGRHQIKVTRICWVKLHDVVHGLPIGHRHYPPADHLHALVQVDLWGWWLSG